MGFSSLPNFLDMAYQAGQIGTNTFVLQLIYDDVTENDTSILYYNDLPDEIEADTLFSSVVAQGYWQLYLVGMYEDDFDITYLASSYAIIDSGTSLFYLN